jgi:hypothetical protein
MKPLLPRPLVLQTLLSAAIVAAALGAYDRLVIRPAQLVGVVDVGEVYRQKEAEFTRILTRAGSEAERDQAVVMARAFARRLPVALEELPRDCACLVLLKSAVAAPTPRTLDLTALLSRKLAP